MQSRESGEPYRIDQAPGKFTQMVGDTSMNTSGVRAAAKSPTPCGSLSSFPMPVCPLTTAEHYGNIRPSDAGPNTEHKNLSNTTRCEPDTLLLFAGYEPKVVKERNPDVVDGTGNLEIIDFRPMQGVIDAAKEDEDLVKVFQRLETQAQPAPAASSLCTASSRRSQEEDMRWMTTPTDGGSCTM